jgi:hypothetical protein
MPAPAAAAWRAAGAGAAHGVARNPRVGLAATIGFGVLAAGGLWLCRRAKSCDGYKRRRQTLAAAWASMTAGR